jgi:hypothetical protein
MEGEAWLHWRVICAFGSFTGGYGADPGSSRVALSKGTGTPYMQHVCSILTSRHRAAGASHVMSDVLTAPNMVGPCVVLSIRPKAGGIPTCRYSKCTVWVAVYPH